MKTTLFAAALLLVINCMAQQQFNNTQLKNNLQSRKVNAPGRAKMSGNSASRSAVQNFTLDYDAIDEQITYNEGAQYYRYIWSLNANAQPSGDIPLRYAIVNFNSNKYLDSASNIHRIPLADIQMHLDSFGIVFSHHNYTGNYDTLTVSIIQSSSIAIVDTGANAHHVGTVLWSESIVTDTSLTHDSTNYYNPEVRNFYPNLSLAAGETFAIRVDFKGDTANKFYIVVGQRDDCNSSCAATLSSSPGNSLYYLSYTSGNSSYPPYSGVQAPYFDCDQSGSFTNSGCEYFYLQNFMFFANVTANVEFGTSILNDSLVLCLGSSYLEAEVHGQANPVTYSWSPAVGLSSTTDADVYVDASALVSPVVYTVTVTDATSATATASVYVTPDRSTCNPIDTVSGSVYFDTNNNGQKDNGEAPYSNAYIAVGNVYVSTDSLGNYSAIVSQQGSHSVYFNSYLYYSWLTEPATGYYNLPSDSNYSDINFGIHVSPDSNNVRITMVNYSIPPRPGFSSYYQLYCENTLGSPFTGAVTLQYDSVQSFTQAVPAPDNINLATRTLSWNVSLAAGSGVVMDIELLAPQTTTLGTLLYETATVTPDAGFNDIDTFDNTYTLDLIVVGSYDPNDKAVSPAGVGVTNSILPGKELTYTIRFQNTGTFYAENVSVADTIDDDMDMSTFKMINASHTYTYTKEGNVIIWRFNKIMLPDSNANEPGSHGFIQYSIRPKSTITHLSVIENTAFIYFDFNAAVVTNTTSNLVDFYLGLNNIAKDAIGVQVFPNPFSGQTNFSINSLEQNLTLRITDITGRTLDEIKNVTTPYYTYQNDKLAKGVYNFDLRNDEGIKARGKLVVQ